jgi:lon-related putative ATP-dependent protease
MAGRTRTQQASPTPVNVSRAGKSHVKTTTARCRLSMRELNHRVNLKDLKFRTTDNLATLEEVIEQERALRAMETGLRIRKRNFNLYISGSTGTGKSSILKGILRRLAEKDPVPPDWCLVHNFKRPEAPIAFPLPPGRAVVLRTAMEALITDLRTEIPKAFHGKNHQERIQRILNAGLERENKAFVDLSKKATEIGFLVKHTKDGLVTIPLVDGKPVGNKEYADLSDVQRGVVDGNRQRLEPVVSHFLETTRDIETGVHKNIQDAQRDLGLVVVERHLKPLRETFADSKPVQAHLDALAANVVDNLQNFLPDESDHQKAERALRKPLVEYQVNVLVDNSETKGAPVQVENTPTYHNLVGKIEKRVENGIYSTDHMLVKAGALLRANGGYLILHIRELLGYPFAWDALKSVLRNQRLAIEEMGEAYQFLPTTGLRPDPVQVQCKVILIGSNQLYHLLTTYDEDFSKLFQVKAEFDSQVRCTPGTIMEYARFVATTCRRESMLPVDKGGVAAIIEFGMRRAGSADRMTLRFNEITNLLVEADALARADGAKVIRRDHVVNARRQRQDRISLMADKSLDDVVDGLLRIDTDGMQIGTLNGLAVYQFADLTFGRPLRISAKVFQGKAGVVNVEREARLAGSTYNKGVLILSGFLGDRFAQDRPLSMSATLAVEQSYGMIDGDSASCAELCALLSALAEVPLRQDLAITGSVSQSGEVQAIGGINEKVEGFFRVCAARGLTGTQGCILPASNVRHLILDPDVLAACEAGTFHLYAAERVEDALELLTGLPAGERGEDGTCPADSLLGRVAVRLAKWAEREKKDHAGDRDEGNGKNGKDTKPNGSDKSLKKKGKTR